VPLPAENPPAAARPSLARIAIAVFAIAFLCALNMIHAYQLGFQSRMYDNPIYRWRQSLAIALSRMQSPPLHGYVGYGSILEYLNQHGLALMDGEAKVMPSGADLAALVEDGARMNRLMKAASEVAIDPKLPPVILQGNELGLVDYMYWAFKIYGININALVLFYFTLLFISVALFVVTFRNCRFCLLLLMLYLAGHYFALDYAQYRGIFTIHNSRFFPVIALVPSLYLILLMATKVPPRPAVLAMAAVQTFILMFIVFCRTQAYWQVAAIGLAGVAVSGLRPMRLALLKPRGWLAAVGATARETWPAVLTVLGVVVLLGYSQLAPDENLYGRESKEHLLWHSLFVSTVSASPQLYAIYGYNKLSDNIGYFAAIDDLRGRNDATSPIAVEADGVLNVDVFKSNGAYDREIRRLFFRVVREHPWLVLRALLIDKFALQYGLFGTAPELWKPGNYLAPILLALAASLLSLALGAAERRVVAARFLFVVLGCSLITTVFDPSPLIVDVVLTWLAAALLCAIYLPLAALFRFCRRDAPALAAT
jgi:hypothetical protein